MASSMLPMPTRKTPCDPSAAAVVQPRKMLADPSTCENLIGTTKSLMRNPVFNRCLYEILECDRKTFKDGSNEGFVWRRKRHVDIGNPAYSLLFQLAKHIAGGSVEFADANALLGALGNRYESLQDKTTSEAAMELKADVIEYMLFDCKFTGISIDPHLVKERLSFNATMVQWTEYEDRILRQITAIGNGPPTWSQLPQPRNLGMCIALAALFKDHPGRQTAVLRAFNKYDTDERMGDLRK